MMSEQSSPSRSQLLQDLELDQERYQVLVDDVRQFCETRARVLEMAKGLPSLIKALSNSEMGFGTRPFVMDDGETCFSVLREDGAADPLPYGYELDYDDIDLPDGAAIFSTLAHLPAD